MTLVAQVASRQSSTKPYQLWLHLLMQLGKKSCIIIHVTTVYTTASVDVEQTHFSVAALLSENCLITLTEENWVTSFVPRQ